MARIDELPVAGKRVLVRVDFNVPLEDGRVASDARIEAALPTIRRLLERGARPILMSHLGRPKGKVVEELRLAPVAARLAELTGWEVACAPDCIGAAAERAAAGLSEGAILLLENLRFHAGETKGDPEFARALAALGEAYVNDAFGTCHRAHASVALVPGLLPSAPGLLLEREVEAFARALERPERPFAAVLGGAKVSDKLPVVRNLLPKVDRLLIGGAMAYTFLKARGLDVGRSRVEDELLGEARRVLDEAEAAGKRVLLPEDHVAAVRFAEDAPYEITGPSIPENLMGLDIGPKTRSAYAEALADAGTVIWNGPMGVFEWREFRRGTEAVARAVAESPAFTICGGGDSVAALELLGLTSKISHVSTGGGASLELLEGRRLPGLAALGLA